MAINYNGFTNFAGGFKVTKTNTPLDCRAVIEKEADIYNVPFPYIGCIIYSVEDDRFFIVKSLKNGYQVMATKEIVAEQPAGDEYVDWIMARGAIVGDYEEFKGGCNCSFNFDSVQKLLDILYDINNGIDTKNKIDELANMLQNQGGGNTGDDSGDNDDEPEVDGGDDPWNPNNYNETQIALKMTQESPGYLIGNYYGDKEFSIEGANYEIEDITIERNGQNEFYKIITLDNFPTKVSFSDGTYIEKVINMCNTSKITDMNCMFLNCIALTSLDLNRWDTSNVTTMTNMFQNSESLVSLDISNWNTSNVESMHAMFSDCNELTSLDVSNWNTNKVTDMANIFSGCWSLTELDLSNWKTDNCIWFHGMFFECKKLTTVGDISNWNTSKVENVYEMFRDCESLKELNLTTWDTSNVPNFNYMFFNCKSLTSLDLSNWKTSNITSLTCTFYGCSSLTHLNLANWNTGNVTYMGSTFGECTSLITLNISGWNLRSNINSSTGSVNGIFKYCTSSLEFENINMSNCSSTTKQMIKNAYNNDIVY